MPTLLIATANQIYRSEFDSDLNMTKFVDRITPTSLTFLAQDNRTFWIDKRRLKEKSRENGQIEKEVRKFSKLRKCHLEDKNN